MRQGLEERPDGSERAEPLVHRHRLSTRLWHWINAVAVTVMLMSGLMIFNAHPRLYWGNYGANPDTPWLVIGDDGEKGFLRLGEVTIPTTGVLGVWKNGAGELNYIAFPGWATIPSTYDLALSRHWHLTFAWLFALGLLAYLLWSLVNRHIGRDLLPRPGELAPRHLWADVKRHATLRFPRGEGARHYNILQKLAYLGVLSLALPGLVLSGITLSPAMNAAWPWLLELFQGRQSARSIHFICAAAVVLFVLVHLLMVVLVGPLNEIRAMITGRYRLPKEDR
ncbi:MAG: cytochrome b/b6 domain-containing protein [Pseudomonadota bacterium]